MYQINLASPATAESRALIAALDAYQNTLYPAESNHLVDLADIDDDALIFMVIRHEDGAAGCGAVLLTGEGCGEIKRVYIDERHRGQKLGEKLMAALEQAARARGCHTLQLETGIHQHAAVKLYERCGYHHTGPFAPYQPDPLSLFMQKRVSATAAAVQ
ncbi:GNAT family N-acetyltransferase [Cronobacter dublinensis subsp. dublinensis]|nr:GNAT family N-acetyltransferase [Cronobacter dublinensis subsp. dublinensis]EGT5668740.1 GNAT family N-acetyltransferase [Cronobacter dublinensis subsp. dublinensis]EGT5671945.1 GNAT family N-acetyltransferase [Cronobacter dublinensis subsp. dublinensis]EGT5676490.1 GNAT family N-acetyltransferase [Cronobacter dublinensis subsp. dublinensis]EGT5684966.1 GNAT family N-acetyltransferase [Cronobacter dublinensis subsp. dublinensis]